MALSIPMRQVCVDKVSEAQERLLTAASQVQRQEVHPAILRGPFLHRHIFKTIVLILYWYYVVLSIVLMIFFFSIKEKMNEFVVP